VDLLADGYGRSLRWALGHRVVIVATALLSLVLMVLSYRGLEQDFLPQEDKGRMFCMVVTPNGSTSEFTDRQLRKAEKIIGGLPEVSSFGAIVAPGFGGGPGQASYGILFVTFKDKRERRRSVQEIVYGPGGVADRFYDEVEGGLAMASLPKAIEVSNGSSFELILQNQDLSVLSKTAQDLANKIRGMNSLRNV